MSSDRQDRREARRRAAHRRIEPDAAPAGEKTALRSRPVRITVDLTPELHRRLTRWTADLAEEIDAVKLPVADVIRAFIHASDDPALRARVVEELQKIKQ